MTRRNINYKVHRWVEDNVDRDQAAMGFVLACLCSATITVGTLFALVSWWLG
ncbi:MAG TPA: hypothetical protein VGU68_02290 [Ktedonobacteraceae bacterium]|nr:hypothetical protein [Ktedonobacteraceae bacterium]